MKINIWMGPADWSIRPKSYIDIFKYLVHGCVHTHLEKRVPIRTINGSLARHPGRTLYGALKNRFGKVPYRTLLQWF